MYEREFTLTHCFKDKEVEVMRRVVVSTAWEDLEKAGGDIVLLLHAKNFDPQKFPEFSKCFESSIDFETNANN